MADLTGMLQASAGAGGEGWDLANAVYNGSPTNWYTITLEPNQNGLFFKGDGTRFYHTGTSDTIREYSLSTAWDVSTASYVQNFSVAAQDSQPSDVFFKPDGTKMYVSGNGNNVILEYDLSTAWDVSTASYVQNFSVSTQTTQPIGLFFKTDGTKMYVADINTNVILEYSLSTAWDISSASYVHSFSVSAQASRAETFFIKPDGTKMYVGDNNGLDVNEYSLSTAWDVSTASYVQNISIKQTENSNGLFFKDDGTIMYVVVGSSDTLYQLTLSTAWDISTASFVAPTTNYLSVFDRDTSPRNVFIKPDGTKFYFVGSTGDSVYEYNLSSAWDISSASYVQNFAVGGQESLPRSLFFKTDGTKMYVCGSSGDDVNEYNLSTAWDISTASFVQTFSIAGQETQPAGLFFRDDGVKMYVCGTTGDYVNEYTLSTAWDISTASYVQNFSVAAQTGTPEGLFFKNDGTKMFVAGGSSVNEYALSTAWDISTASFTQSFSVAPQQAVLYGLSFKADGKKFYITGTQDSVVSFDL